MSERERQRTERAQTHTAGTPDGADLGGVRASAEQLLRAADEAIARALSGDSEQFLHATRQSGGQ